VERLCAKLLFQALFGFYQKLEREKRFEPSDKVGCQLVQEFLAKYGYVLLRVAQILRGESKISSWLHPIWNRQ
jgi:hypothetical protein